MTSARPPEVPTAAGFLLRAGLVMTVAAVASRILGWIRLLVIGAQFGASSELDAYLAAFRIPDAIFQLVVAGALSAALIPVYSGYRARGEDREGWELASSVINLVVIGLAATVTSRDGVDAGALRLARQLEPLTAVLISINKKYKTHSGVRISGI